MTAAAGIESRARARVREMLKASTTFVEWMGANANLDARIHDDEILENFDPSNPNEVTRPLALIEEPRFDMQNAATSGPELDYRAAGDVTLSLESQYLADVDVKASDAKAAFLAFEGVVGKIREELMDLRNDPLGETSYVYFTAIRTVVHPIRTAEIDRGPGNHFFFVKWLFSTRGGE
jgi:hypothetical protein